MTKGKLYLLQARAITTLTAGNLDTYELNYSLLGDELWTNTNVAEAIPDVYAPFTWSIGRQLDEALNFIPGYYIFSGNIYGRHECYGIGQKAYGISWNGRCKHPPFQPQGRLRAGKPRAGARHFQGHQGRNKPGRIPEEIWPSRTP